MSAFAKDIRRNFDANKNGSIDAYEFGRGIKDLLKVPHQESVFDMMITTIFNILDKSGKDHCLSSKEFSKFIDAMPHDFVIDRPVADKETHFNRVRLNLLKLLFNVIDGNGSGKINQSEIKPFLASFGITRRKDIKAFMKSVDADGDGKINFEEFINWFTASQQELHEEQHASAASDIQESETDPIAEEVVLVVDTPETSETQETEPIIDTN